MQSVLFNVLWLSFLITLVTLVESGLVFQPANPERIENQRIPYCCFKLGIAKHGYNAYEDLFNSRVEKMIALSEATFKAWDPHSLCDDEEEIVTDGFGRCTTIVFGRSVADDGTSYIDFAKNWGFISHEPLNQFSLGFSPLLTYTNYVPKFITKVIYRSSGAFDFPSGASLKDALDGFLTACANAFAFSCVEIYFVACKTDKDFYVIRKELTPFANSHGLPSFAKYDRNSPLQFCTDHATAPWTAKTLHAYNPGALSWVAQMPSKILPNLFTDEADKKLQENYDKLVVENEKELASITGWTETGQPVKGHSMIQRRSLINKRVRKNNVLKKGK